MKADAKPDLEPLFSMWGGGWSGRTAGGASPTSPRSQRGNQVHLRSSFLTPKCPERSGFSLKEDEIPNLMSLRLYYKDCIGLLSLPVGISPSQVSMWKRRSRRWEEVVSTNHIILCWPVSESENLSVERGTKYILTRIQSQSNLRAP